MRRAAVRGPNIIAPAVEALRSAGHDVAYSGERPSDPGDVALLVEAVSARRVFVTKDHDFGALVFRDALPHCGVLLIDDLGNAAEESASLLSITAAHGERLTAGAFLRAGSWGVRG